MAKIRRWHDGRVQEIEWYFDRMEIEQLYNRALQERPEYRTIPEEKIKTLIKSAAEEIAILEKTG